MRAAGKGDKVRAMPREKSKAPAWVGLLRGVNVGGKNRVAMRDLIALFEGEGCTDVATHIQSGNVVFRAGLQLAERLSRSFEQHSQERLGCSVPLLLRTGPELDQISRANPFLKAGAPESGLHVVFLRDEPDPPRAAALDPARSPPDEFLVRGREVYLSCPNGLGRSKLSNAWFDSKLATVSTGRNWRTVLALRDLALALDRA
jgi:uncharacterized protein (DUF1697 family)